jgi:hypothetical protein
MAADNRRRPKDVFLSYVSPGFLRSLIDRLGLEYPKAVRDCEHLPDAQAHYLVPHTRFANIEAALMDLQPRFPEIAVKVVPNEAGECHIEIECGPVRLTVSHADHPSRIVRDARFRRTYAEDNQECLFDCGDRPPAGNWLYAIVLHGSNGDWRSLGFADVVFPMPMGKDGIRYHSDRLHLVSMFAKQTGKSGHDGKVEPRKEPEIG